MKKIIALMCLSSLAISGISQTRLRARYPSPESATFDNNGNDLRGFVSKYGSDFQAKGNAVNEASGGDWGYLQIKNVKTPGTDKEGNLNYQQSFDVTLAMMKTRNGAKATWWSREFNSSKGKLIYFKVGDEQKVGLENVKYSEVINELQPKSFTVVEFADSLVSTADFDILLKNHILIRNGSMKDMADYKKMVSFYNGFISKFTNVNDAVVDNKSFITFFGNGNNHYAGYFNIVDGRLSGRVEQIDAPFEKDRVKFINDMFKKLTGSYIYVYGDDAFGMERIIKTRADKSNIKVEYWKTSTSRKFNQDI